MVIINISVFRKKITKLNRLKYNFEFDIFHKKVDDIFKTSMEDNNTKSFNLSFVYPVDFVYGKYDQHSFKVIKEKRNKNASVSVAVLPRFKNTTMSESEHRILNYQATNRIFNEIDKERKKTSKELDEVNFDVFE